MEFSIGTILILLFVFFSGRASGQTSEKKNWEAAILEGIPMIIKGELFVVKHIEGDNHEEDTPN